ncbi:MAG TPA: aspartyl protease family protein [Myxococcales bacterium]|nr:aspartyl protease family protein [Myxococcales bacterium]
MHALVPLLFALSLSAAPSLPLAVPFDLDSNQIFVRARINGGEPRWFIVDTGASADVIDAGLVTRLGLKVEGSREGSGAGKGTVKISFVKGVTYDVGGATQVVPSSYAIDLSGQPALLGREVAGILGYDFFARYVVEVDYDAQVLVLHEPAAFQPPAGAEPVKVTLEKQVPHVPVEVQIAGKPPVTQPVLVDSGSQDALDVDAMAQSPVKMEVVGGVGLGKEFRITVGRAESMKLGRFVLRGPVGSGGGVPLIGNEILRRFHVAFDYSRQVMYLEPNRHLDDAFVVDASGLDLRYAQDRRGFDVHDVASASPAAEAGIKTGDVLVAIDGRDGPELGGLEKISRLLTRAGATHRLTLRRGSQTQDVQLKLRKRL